MNIINTTGNVYMFFVSWSKDFLLKRDNFFYGLMENVYNVIFTIFLGGYDQLLFFSKQNVDLSD